MILDDIRKLSSSSDTSGDESLEKEGDLWMITGGRSTLVRDESMKYLVVGSPNNM